VKYLGEILIKISWNIHIENFAAKGFRKFISIYHLLKIECLSVNRGGNLCKPSIRSILTYACTTWEFVGDSHHLQLQRLQNKVVRTTGNLTRRTLNRDLHMAFKIPYSHYFLQNYAGSKEQKY
jgi:hypothetical protein